MAFVPETGAGLTDSTSFTTVEFADAYALEHDMTEWAALTTELKQKHLNQGTEDLCLKFANKWTGIKKTAEQALPFPRYDIVTYDGFDLPDDSVPVGLAKATVEMAYQRAIGVDVLAPVTSPGDIKLYEVEVGPIREKTEYAGSQSQTTIIPRIRKLLTDLIVSANEIQRA